MEYLPLTPDIIYDIQGKVYFKYYNMISKSGIILSIGTKYGNDSRAICVERDINRPYHILADAKCMSMFSNNSVEMIWAEHVMEHNKVNVFEVLNEFDRILIPGGYIVMVTPDARFLPDENSWSPNNFKLMVLDKLTNYEIVQHDTILSEHKLRWAFDSVIRKKSERNENDSKIFEEKLLNENKRNDILDSFTKDSRVFEFIRNLYNRR